MGRSGAHAFSTGSQRHLPHRPRQEHLPEFWSGGEYGGLCNLRFDDTNPTKEEQEYVDAIAPDVRWLGFDWGDREYLRPTILTSSIAGRCS